MMDAYAGNLMDAYLSHKTFLPDLCREYPNNIFVFGDNLERWGKAGQAVIRDESNAYGIPTKRSPRTTEDAYFSDFDFIQNARHIDAAIDRIMAAYVRNVIRKKHCVILFPKAGLGTGYAKLPIRAPLTYEYLCLRLMVEFEISWEDQYAEIL